jgi:hypothetical protein
MLWGTENPLAPAQITTTTNCYLIKQVISGLNMILKLPD